MRAALATERCASSEKYMTPERKSSGSRVVRAVTIAVRFEIDPPEVRMPPAPGG